MKKTTLTIIISAAVALALIIGVSIPISIKHKADEIKPTIYPAWLIKGANNPIFQLSNEQAFTSKAYNYLKENPYFKSFPVPGDTKSINMYTTPQGIKNADAFYTLADNYFEWVIVGMGIDTPSNWFTYQADDLNQFKNNQLEDYENQQTAKWLSNVYYPSTNNSTPPNYIELIRKVAKAKAMIIFTTEWAEVNSGPNGLITQSDLTNPDLYFNQNSI